MPVFPNSLVWDNLSPGVSDFEHLTFMGVSHFISPLTEKSEVKRRTPCPYFSSYNGSCKPLLLSNVGDFYRAVCTYSFVEKSVRKMDFPRVMSVDQVLYDLAFDYVCQKLTRHFEKLSFHTVEIAMSTMDLTTSSGIPWGSLGIKTKKEFFEHPEIRSYLASNRWFNPAYPPLWKVWPKIEWRSGVDIDNKKVRTFIIPPPDLVFGGKLVYGHQNYGLMDFWWSAYGFNPYAGGTDRMAQKLLLYQLYLIYDVSGWDRKLPNLKDVYRIRHQSINPAYFAMAHFLAKTFCKSFIVLPDGRVFKKKVGNNSGSPNTTSDNIIAHLIILFYCLLVLYKGDVKLAEQCVAFIFGDDNAVGLILPDGCSVDSFKSLVESTFIECFSHFGLELDPVLVTTDIQDVNFLGFTITECPLYPGKYVPRYDTGRLLASLCYQIEGHDLPAVFSKAFTLTVMSASGDRDIFDAMLDYFSFLVREYYDYPDPVVQSYVQMGPPSRDDCFRFMLGLESSCVFTLEEGWYKYVDQKDLSQ